MTEKYGMETLIVDDPEDEGGCYTGDVVSPINLSTTFEMEEAGAPSHGYKYSRFGNPTLARLEGAEEAVALSSGMAAISTVCLTALSPGDHVVAFESLFGGTKEMFDEVLASVGVDVSYVDATDPENVAAAVTPETELV